MTDFATKNLMELNFLPAGSRQKYEKEKNEARSRLPKPMQEITVAVDQCRMRLPQEVGAMKTRVPLEDLAIGRLSWVHYPDFSAAVADANRCNLDECNLVLRKHWAFKIVRQKGKLVVVQG